MTEVEALKAWVRELEEENASLKLQRETLVLNLNALRAELVKT